VSDNIKVSVLDFLVNDDFISYVMNPTSSLTEKWMDYFRKHRSQIPISNEARNILLGYVDKKLFPNHEALELKARIFQECDLPLLSYSPTLN